MVHPTPNGLVGHRHSALRQQILDVTQAEGEPEVEPYCLENDLGRETIPGVADLVHPRWATRPPRTPQAQSAVTMPSSSLRRPDDRADFVEPDPKGPDRRSADAGLRGLGLYGRCGRYKSGSTRVCRCALD